MLKLHLETMFRLRGITNPYNWMVHQGIAPGTARKVITGGHRTMPLNVMEILCEHLRCTPNDLLEWRVSDARAVAGHPLLALRTTEQHDLRNLVENLSHMSVDELRKLAQQTGGTPQKKD